jgi:3-methyladenine DNA glycosylase AlkD
MARLRALARPVHRDGMAHFGIETASALGIAVPELRRLAREFGRDHALAAELWATGVHEARSLACMVEEPARVTSKQADAWARDIDSWDLCDGFAYDLISYTPLAWKKPAQWGRSRHEFTKRAAFALIAGIAVHGKQAPDAEFIALLPLIRTASDDDRHFVKKAVNWALRQIGKRNLALNRAAIVCAEELRKLDSRPARRIAADALRELRSDAVQVRLRRPAAKR